MVDSEVRAPDERLRAIAGRWATSGHVIGEPSLPISGTDTYEVFMGGYFVVHHVDVTVGDRPVRAIEVIGEPDTAHVGYLARSFDSEGRGEVMLLRIGEDGVFRFTGGADVASAAQPMDVPTEGVRSTLPIAADRRSMTALWERSEDGVTWQPWMTLTFARRPVAQPGHNVRCITQ